MAVEFNLTLALQQESKAKEYYQLYCNGEMEISDEDLQALQNQYKGKIEHWKPEETTDQNNYTIEDDNDNDLGKEARTATSAISLGGGIIGLVGGAKGGILGCLAAFATGLMYTIANPNKAEHEELMELQDIMEGKLTDIDNANGNIEVTQEEIDAVLEEYNSDKDNITAAIEAKTAELEALKEERQTLQDKVDAGEELDESEQTKYEELNGQIGALSHEVAVLNAALTQLTEDTTEQVEAEGENLEEAQNTALSAEEAAEKAAKFDEQTKTNATTEAITQGINVVGGTLSVASVAPMAVNPFTAAVYAPIAAAGASGVVMSGIGVGEQIKIASDITEEINVRKNLFDSAINTGDAADAELDNIERNVNNIGQELPEIPEEQEESEIPADFGVQPQQGEESESEEEVNPEDPKKKPEDV